MGRETAAQPGAAQPPERTFAPVKFGRTGFQITSLDQAYRFGKHAIQSRLFPQFEHPSQIVMVFQIAADNRMPLSLALQNIAFINNRACVWGDGLIGIAYNNPAFGDIKEEFRGSGDTLTAVCTVQRKGMNTTVVRTFSMEDAKRAGLLDKRGDIWKKYPGRMCQMRARSWALRDAGLTQGIIAREEAMDMDVIDVPGRVVESGKGGDAEPEPPTATDRLADKLTGEGGDPFAKESKRNWEDDDDEGEQARDLDSDSGVLNGSEPTCPACGVGPVAHMSPTADGDFLCVECGVRWRADGSVVGAEAAPAPEVGMSDQEAGESEDDNPTSDGKPAPAPADDSAAEPELF